MTTSCLCPQPRRASLALLAGNSRRGNFVLDTGSCLLEGDVSQERRLGSVGASLGFVSGFSIDPMSYSAGDSNLYRYCGNGPASRTDPTGQQTPGYEVYQAMQDFNYIREHRAEIDANSSRNVALRNIMANRTVYIEDAAAKISAILKGSPPKGRNCPTLTAGDREKVATAVAEIYVKVVEERLKQWPGATPSNGWSAADWKEGYYEWTKDFWVTIGKAKDDQDIANSPVCSDWAGQITGAMQNALGDKSNSVTLSSGSISLSCLVEVKWGQWLHWKKFFEHNFPVMYPKGVPPANWKEGDYLILNEWATLLPNLQPAGYYPLELLDPFAAKVNLAPPPPFPNLVPNAHKMQLF